ncbi:hypothetical protein Tco_0307043 [Tanacetum coccineum]
MIIKKDSEIVKEKVERKSLALKAKKESSDEEWFDFRMNRRTCHGDKRLPRSSLKESRFVKQPRMTKRPLPRSRDDYLLVDITVKMIKKCVRSATQSSYKRDESKTYLKIKKPKSFYQSLGVDSRKRLMQKVKMKTQSYVAHASSEFCHHLCQHHVLSAATAAIVSAVCQSNDHGFGGLCSFSALDLYEYFEQLDLFLMVKHGCHV